jgi:Antitoxin VbhA
MLMGLELEPRFSKSEAWGLCRLQVRVRLTNSVPPSEHSKPTCCIGRFPADRGWRRGQSNEMEGLHVNADTLADADDYVAGRIDSDELVARARARYGLA